MGRLINKKLSEDELDNKLETLKLENQVLSQEVSKAQQKAMMAEIKKKYGSGWKKALSLGKDSESLKQFSETRWKLI